MTWYEKGEMCNMFFYNLEKRNKAKTYVKTLVTDNIVTQEQESTMKNLNEFPLHTEIIQDRKGMPWIFSKN